MSWPLAQKSTMHLRRWAIVAIALAGSISLYFLASAALVQGTAARAEIVAPAHAAALVAATTGDQSAEVQATGEKAKVLNAAMPFSETPVQAARAFVISAGETIDQRRALLCLTQAVYYEAGYEPIEGRRAVAQVVLNRLRHPAFPKSVCGVVYQRNSTPVCQFTFVCDGSLDRRPSPDAWRQAEAVARAALAGYVETSVGEATHYHADYVAPRWAPMLTKISQLGAHIFYRWPGSWGQAGAFTGRYIGEPRDPATMRPLILPRAQSQNLPTLNDAVAYAGPPIARAPNDVGGLLDTSKGWTLNIPMPSEAGTAAKAIAEQQQRQASKLADAPQNGAPSETRVIASR